jgi:hypothetical protein
VDPPLKGAVSFMVDVFIALCNRAIRPLSNCGKSKYDEYLKFIPKRDRKNPGLLLK